MTDDCSKKALREIDSDGTRAAQLKMYLTVFQESEFPLSHLQATQEVFKRFTVIAPDRNGRINDLEKVGLIEKADKIKCEVTHKTVNRWRWTGRTKPMESREEFVECKHCEGKGGRVETVYRDEPKGQADFFGHSKIDALMQ